MAFKRGHRWSLIYRNMAAAICVLAIICVIGCSKKPEVSNANTKSGISVADSETDIQVNDQVTSEDLQSESESKFSELSSSNTLQKSSQPAQIDLPMPPSGFSWKYCEDIKGAFLFPEGWYWKQVNAGEQFSYFITKESIEENGVYETGLSIVVLPDITTSKKMKPSQYALEFVKIAMKEKECLDQWQNDLGPFRGYGCLLRDVQDDGSDPIITHNLLIANDKTGTLYLVLFESPEVSWEKEWKIGEVILARLYIDDTI